MAGCVVGIGIKTGGVQAVRQLHLPVEPGHRATGGMGVEISTIRVVIGGTTPAPSHRPQQQGIVVKHLLEVGHHPLGIRGVPVEPATDLVEDAAAHQVLTRVLRHIEAGRVSLDQQGVQQGGVRELRRSSEAAMHDVVVRSHGVNELTGDRTRGVRDLLDGTQMLDDGLGRGHHLIATLSPCTAEGLDQLHEGGLTTPAHRREIGAGEEGLAVRSQEDGVGPATLASHRQGHLHQRGVNLWTLLAIDLDGHDIGVDDLSHFWIGEGLEGHDVAPVAARVAHRDHDRHVATPCFGECFLSPREPVDGVRGVLEQIWAGGLTKVVGHGGQPTSTTPY